MIYSRSCLRCFDAGIVIEGKCSFCLLFAGCACSVVASFEWFYFESFVTWQQKKIHHLNPFEDVVLVENGDCALAMLVLGSVNGSSFALLSVFHSCGVSCCKRFPRAADHHMG